MGRAATLRIAAAVAPLESLKDLTIAPEARAIWTSVKDLRLCSELETLSGATGVGDTNVLNAVAFFMGVLDKAGAELSECEARERRMLGPPVA